MRRTHIPLTSKPSSARIVAVANEVEVVEEDGKARQITDTDLRTKSETKANIKLEGRMI